MHRLGHSVWGLIAGAGVAAVLAVSASGASSPTWVEVPSVHISGDSNSINALVATGPNDVWAFGNDYSTIGEWRVLGERWQGHGWTRLNMPDRETAPAQDFLSAAAATGPDDVWAVGSSATAQGNQLGRDLIEHWDGRAWAIVDPHLSAGVRRNLSGVATPSAGDVWAVGDATYPGGPDYVPLVVHRTSRGWASSPFHLRVPGCGSFTRGVLGSVVLLGGRDMYAAGWCQFENLRGPNGPQRGYVAHWNGTTWSLALQAPLGEEINALTRSPDGQVWAAGDTATPGSQNVHGVLWHGAGTTWRRVVLPGGSGVSGRINAVAATNRVVYAAGSYSTAGATRSYVLAVDPATGRSRYESISPGQPTTFVFVGALVAPAGASPWLGGLADENAVAGGQAILAHRVAGAAPAAP